MTQRIEVSIVSGTYNRLAYLKSMIASVRESAKGTRYEIIIVDGGSTDGTLEWLSRQRDIRTIKHGELRGAIAAFNDGAYAANGEYVVFSNDDLVFVDDSIRVALLTMRQHPDVGIGCFYTDRGNKPWHVDQMPAHFPNGRMTNVAYGGIVIIPRWLGNKLEWWTLPGARTYGGDNALCARAWEAGWPVVPIEGTKVREELPIDELKLKNMPPGVNNHPDTVAYLKVYPRGPRLTNARQFEAPREADNTLRILYAPIYEHHHKIQREQKTGLRRALQRIGTVKEVDYQTTGPDSVLKLAAEWKPDWVITQLHYATPFGPQHSAKLRELLPNAKLINWNGDVYDRSDDAAYIQTLQPFDLHGVVNASSIPSYRAQGIRAFYWQAGFEADGVGHEPAPWMIPYDVVLLGSGYSKARHQFAAFLKSLPYNLGIFGGSWPEGVAVGDNTYDFRTGCQIMRNAKIVLGDSQWATTARGFVSNRLFQALAAGGGMVLHQAFDGMEEHLHLRDGVHLITWTDHEDLRAKLAYWLDPSHEAERAEIVRNGQRECLRNHSFEARVRELQHMLEYKSPVPPGVRPEMVDVIYA